MSPSRTKPGHSPKKHKGTPINRMWKMASKYATKHKGFEVSRVLTEHDEGHHSWLKGSTRVWFRIRYRGPKCANKGDFLVVTHVTDHDLNITGYMTYRSKGHVVKNGLSAFKAVRSIGSFKSSIQHCKIHPHL